LLWTLLVFLSSLNYSLLTQVCPHGCMERNYFIHNSSQEELPPPSQLSVEATTQRELYFDPHPNGTLSEQPHQLLPPIPLHPFLVQSPCCICFTSVNLPPAPPIFLIFYQFLPPLAFIHSLCCISWNSRLIAVIFNSGTQRDSFMLALHGVDWLTLVFLCTSVACTHNGHNRCS
jgi:hypothetical protein